MEFLSSEYPVAQSAYKLWTNRQSDWNLNYQRVREDKILVAELIHKVTVNEIVLSPHGQNIAVSGPIEVQHTLPLIPASIKLKLCPGPLPHEHILEGRVRADDHTSGDSLLHGSHVIVRPGLNQKG